jgi:hypothetical protein
MDLEMKLLVIYDNGGKTVDRYTVVTDVIDHSGQYHDCLGLSDDLSPQGYSQWGVVLKNDERFNFKNKQWRTRNSLGKRISFENMDAKHQQHIARRLWGED